MTRMYEAILKGDRLEWKGDAPKHLGTEHAVAVHITLWDEPLDESDRLDQGQHMAAALEQLAAIHALPGIEDPVGWERELRQEDR